MGLEVLDIFDAPEVVEKKPETKKDKLSALSAVKKTLDKQFDTKTSLVKMGDRVGIVMPSISTALPTLDYDVIGTGGIPRGGIIEIFGPESCGKTTLVLHIIGEEQKRGEFCAFIDAEHALDPNYAATLGVNVDDLFISQPDSGEQALETVIQLVKSQAVSLIVVDSVAALVPQAELDGEMGDAHMGLQARLMSQGMRKLRGICKKNGVTVIFINQIREKIGVMFGSPETTTGGRALRFYSWLRLDLRRKEVIKDGDTQIGHKIRIKAVKNKVGSPFRETEIALIYESGIDTIADVIEYASKLGVLERSGAWYSFQGEKVGQGMDKSKEALKGNVELFSKVLRATEEARVENKGDTK